MPWQLPKLKKVHRQFWLSSPWGKKKKQTTTYFLFCYWEFQSICCQYILKSDFQSGRNTINQLLSPRSKISQASWGQLHCKSNLFCQCWWPILAGSSGCSKKPCCSWFLRRELGAFLSHLLSCRLEATDQGWLIHTSKIITEETLI